MLICYTGMQRMGDWGEERWTKIALIEKTQIQFPEKIIIRFDYDGMDDTELDQVISSISMELKGMIIRAGLLRLKRKCSLNSMILKVAIMLNCMEKDT